MGAGTETDLADDGFVRVRCDVIDNSGRGVDIDDRATLLEILEIVNRLNGSDARKDVRAIKSMKSVDRIITEWDAQCDEDTTSPDSEVLKKVVEIMKNWDDRTGRAFPTLYKILDLLVDYTEAPEAGAE